MQDTLKFARQMSLVLFVVTLVNFGHHRADYAGTTPTSFGLVRLNRDISRRAGGEVTELVDTSAAAARPPALS